MISSIEIKNFKCFENSIINLGDLTVLSGSNSVGKTSIIQALLLTKISIDKLNQYGLWTDEKQSAESKYRIFVPLNGKYFMNLGNTKEVLTRDVNSNEISLKLTDSQKSSHLLLSYKAEDNLDDFYDLELTPNWKNENSFDNLKREFYYLNAERLGPRLSYDVDQLDYFHVGWQGEFTVQVLSQLKEESITAVDKRGYKDIEDAKLRTQVRAWMNRIIPGFYLDDALLEGKLKKAHVTYSKSSPTNVGFGISYVLPIIVNGLIAKTDSLFIVENPEAHLHPAGQSQIGRFLGMLSNAGLQVIVETHSEHVINGMRLSQLIDGESHKIINFLSKDENNKVTVREISVNASADLDSYPVGFFDQEQRDIEQLIVLKRVSKR